MSRKLEVQLEYDGSKQPEQKGIKDHEGREYRPYIPGEDLKEAVRLAIALDMPLLLEGDPGCGKTCLAGAIAYEFTQKYCQKKSKEKGLSFWYPFETWNVTSSTRAVDGRYTYDALRRLRDAQLAGANLKELAANLGEEGDTEVKRIVTDLKDRRNYLTLGKLGRSFQNTEYRPILLIDEVDKADSDFPNDLLRELEEFRFEISETGETIPDPKIKDKVKKPIIIITSNREKPLPDPFLRCCIYFYVEFPNEERLKAIIHTRFGKGPKAKETICDQAIHQFYQIRTLLESRPGSRAPGTSEFLKFLDALLQSPKTAKKQLANLGQQRSLLGILVKTKADLDLLSRELSTTADE